MLSLLINDNDELFEYVFPNLECRCHKILENFLDIQID